MVLKNKMYQTTPYFLFYTFLLILYSVGHVNAQDKTIELYIEKCKRNFRNSDSLFYYSNLLIQKNEPKAKVEGYYSKGYAFKNNMQLDSALFYFDKAATFVDDSDYSYLIRIMRLSLVTAAQAADYKRAFQYSDKMKKLAIEKDDSLTYATAINHEGIIFKNKGNLNAAIERYVLAGKIQKSNNFPKLPYTYTNIAIAYTELKQDSLSLIWFHKAYESALNVNDSTIIIRSISNLGNYYKQNNNVDLSLYYFNKLLENDKIMRIDDRSFLYQNLADLHNKKNDYEKALFFYKMAEPMVKEGQNLRRKIELLSVLFQMEKKRNNSTEVLAIADTLIELIKKANIPKKFLPVYLEKAKIFKEQGEYEKAVIAFDKYNKLNDSLQRLQDAETIQRVVSEFDLIEKDLELKSVTANKQIKYITTVVIISLLVFLIIFYYVFLYKKNKLENKNQEIETKQVVLKTKEILNCDDIIYIKSDGPYLEYFILSKDEPTIERNTLKAALDLLKENGFIQVHRSYVINQSKVKSIYANSIFLENNMEVPLSRSFKQKLKEEQHPFFQ